MFDNLLAFGWKLFPCHSIVDGKCSCSKGSKCESPGKHPRVANGVKEASNDPAVIQNWATIWPETNWALACGAESGVVVIDIDPRHDGFESFDEYETNRRDGALPKTIRSHTGGGGKHLFFRYPDTGVVLKNRVNWLPGVDVRSNGGYVILPPGNHISGGRYRWESLDDVTLTDLPLDVAADMASGAQNGTSGVSGYKDTASLLDGVPEGSRDDTLFRWACSLRRKHESDSDGGRAIVTTLILKAADASDFPRDEALKCVESAFAQDHKDEMDVLGFFPLTDVGNRDRFLQLHGDDLRYVPAIGWYQWSDRGWTFAEDMVIQDLTEDVIGMIEEEMIHLNDTFTMKAYTKHLHYTSSHGGLSNIEKRARSHPSVLRSADDFDRKQTELACANGIVDLTTGEIRPFSRNDLVTKNTGLNYNPNAKGETWSSFLETSTQGDKELQEYLQLAAGYTATGLNTQECFFIISGPPASGKSSYIDGIQTALGQYAISSQSEVFMFRRNKDTAQNEIARFAGIRQVSVSEIRENEYLNDTLIKQITGGDRITGRHLFKNTFEFTPQFKLWIATNHDPQSSDKGMMRRIKRINFTHAIPKEQRDPRVKQRIRTVEQEAILAWIVEGAIKFLARGDLNEPESVKAAVSMYEEEQDVFTIFVQDTLHESPGAATSLSDVYVAYTLWCARMSNRPIGIVPFRRKLQDRGFAVFNDEAGVAHFQGVETKSFSVPSIPWA